MSNYLKFTYKTSHKNLNNRLLKKKNLDLFICVKLKF